MKRDSIASRCLLILLVVSMILSGCAKQETTNKEISVAIYPYIPDMELFENVLTKQWKAIEPDVELKFVDWDCYVEPNPENIDVIMYDALFTSHLAETGAIQPIKEEEVHNISDSLRFAVDGAYHNGEMYGIPYLVCSYFLIHFADDEEMAAVDNFNELYAVISERKNEDESTGMLINYSSDYPYHYLDILMDCSGQYTTYEEAPSLESPDPQAVEKLNQIRSILAAEPEKKEGENLGTFRRGALFNDGYGCAYYGYSEDMHFMGDVLDDIEIRTISFSEKENIQLFFADIVSMGAHVTDPVKQDLCKKLMNLIGSEEFLRELCFGSGDLQYMLPVKKHLLAEAAAKYPMYDRLNELALQENNHIIRFGPDVFAYLDSAYGKLPG